MKNEGAGEAGDEDGLKPPVRNQIDTLRDQLLPEMEELSFIESAPEPTFVLHVSSGVFVQVSETFQSLFGYPPDLLYNGTIRAPDLLAKRDRERFDRVREDPTNRSDESCRMTCRDRSGNNFSARVSVRVLNAESLQLLYGTVRNRVEDDHDTLRRMVGEAQQINKGLRTLMDKLVQITQITAELLKIKREIGVISKARSMLCDRTRMNLKDVSFLLQNESGDQLSPPFQDDPDRSIDMNVDHPANEVMSGEADHRRPGENELILPLHKGGDRMGVVWMTLQQDERSLLEENDRIWSAYLELMTILTGMIGLMIRHCRLIQKERQESIHDALTGVFNRRHFNQKLKQEVRRVQRYGGSLSLMIIDVDNFKKINDRYGHQQGDRILQQIASTLKTTTRSSDILCRYGGDEFALLLPMTGGNEAERKARLLLEKFERTSFTVRTDESKSQEISVSVSIGVSVLPHEETPVDRTEERFQNDLLKRADRCMFQAKDDEGHAIRSDVQEEDGVMD